MSSSSSLNQLWRTALVSLQQRILTSSPKRFSLASSAASSYSNSSNNSNSRTSYSNLETDSWLRKCLRDIRTGHSWQKSLEVFDAALLSGACVDGGTFRENALSCRCGMCKIRVRCTGISALCLAEVDQKESMSSHIDISDSSSLSDQIDKMALRRLAERHRLIAKQNHQSITTTSGTPDTDGVRRGEETTTTLNELIDKWRTLETFLTFSSKTTSGNVVLPDSSFHGMEKTCVASCLQLVRSSIDFIRQEEMKRKNDNNLNTLLFIHQILMFAPYSSRVGVWEHLFQFLHHERATLVEERGNNNNSKPNHHRLLLNEVFITPLHARSKPISSSWTPKPQATAILNSGSTNREHKEIIQDILFKSTSSSSTSSSSSVLIPSPDLFRHSAGLTTLAELSRHSEILIPHSVIYQVLSENRMLSLSKNDNSSSNSSRDDDQFDHDQKDGDDPNTRRIAVNTLKVLFPKTGKAPPKRVTVLSLIDELMILDCYFSSPVPRHQSRRTTVECLNKNNNIKSSTKNNPAVELAEAFSFCMSQQVFPEREIKFGVITKNPRLYTELKAKEDTTRISCFMK